MSFKTLSAILRGQWLINPEYVQAHLPLIHGVITGSANGAELFKGAGELEKPFVYADGKRIDVYTYDWKSGNFKPNEEIIPENSIAVIPMIGPVMKYNGDCGEPGMIKRSSWVSDFEKIDKISGFIFYIDSPGGQADGTPQFAELVKSISKPTVAYVDGGAYSAGMWVASACDEIVLSGEFTGVGSIGAYTTLVDYRGYFEKQGFKVTEIYPDESSEKNLGYRKALDGDISLMKQDIAELATFFIQSFAENRGDKLTSDVWNKGKTFKGAEAISIGLADHIGPFTLAAELIHNSDSKSKTLKNNNPKNQKTMKFTNVAALAGIEAPTKELLDLANADLTTSGITRVTLVPEEFITEAATVTAENVRLTTELANASEKGGTSTNALATANTRVAELEAQLAAMPGATHETQTGNDSHPDGQEDDPETIMASLPHNKRADAL